MHDPQRLGPSRRQCLAALTVILTGLVACDGGPGSPGEPNVQEVLADSLILTPGVEVRIQRLRLAFLGVADDTRCPIDALCVWQGNAVVRIAMGVGTEPSQTYTANTAWGSAPVEHRGYRLTLLSLAPIPRAAIPVPAAEYRAAVRVEVTDGERS